MTREVVDCENIDKLINYLLILLVIFLDKNEFIIKFLFNSIRQRVILFLSFSIILQVGEGFSKLFVAQYLDYMRNLILFIGNFWEIFDNFLDLGLFQWDSERINLCFAQT